MIIKYSYDAPVWYPDLTTISLPSIYIITRFQKIGKRNKRIFGHIFKDIFKNILSINAIGL